MINPKTRNRIKQSIIDAGTGEELQRRDLVKGFEVEKDEYILIEPEDLEALKIESSKTLDIEQFVDASSIDRIYWDEPYYMVPDGKAGSDAFAVILQAMKEKKRIAIGRLVLSQRERIVALEPRDDCILLTTLRARDEVRDPESTASPPRLPKAQRAMLDIAEKIIEQQEGDFTPENFTDRYETAVRALIERKRKGQKPVRAERPGREEAQPTDLMEQLKRSIAAHKPTRRANDNPVPGRKPRRAA